MKDFILATGNRSSELRIPPGNKQVFMIFTRPGDDTKEFAAPVGYVDGTGYTFYLDTLFFYDDVNTFNLQALAEARMGCGGAAPGGPGHERAAGDDGAGTGH